MWSNCFCFVLVTSSKLARQLVFQNLFENFIYMLPRDVNKSQNGLFQKKMKQGGLKVYFCENSPGIFHFFTLPLEILDKTKLNPWIFFIVLDPLAWKFHDQKQRSMEIPHYFFLFTLGNSTSFLMNSKKFHALFL